jgi:uncharacterized protein
MSETKIVVGAGEGQLVRARAGQRIVVEDPEGGQVGDLFAFVADDPTEHLSASHTRAALRRLFPAVGESFWTTARRPILTLEEDTSPGVHDMLVAACDPERYRQLGAEGGHRSCATNLRDALAPLGVDVPVVPQPVNVFMNTPPIADGTIVYGESPSEAGDRLVLRAELDVLVVLSACPMDLITISRGGPGPLAIDVID